MEQSERMFIQISDEWGDPIDETHGELTRCADQINNDDVEYVRLDLYEQLEARNKHLEFTLELEEAWDEEEHTFFADFLVVKIEQLQKKILELEGDDDQRLD